jgi:MFS family permease
MVLFLGMFFGAGYWGARADVAGRVKVFTQTMLVSGVMGLASGAAVSFPILLLCLVLLGFGVGGNMPVDTALLSEFLPSEHRGKMLVLLSIFWSVGSVLAALLAWILITNFSCPVKEDGEVVTCDWHDNFGWRIVWASLGAVNFTLLLSRLGMIESPAYEASLCSCQRGMVCECAQGVKVIAILNTIARVNGIEGVPVEHVICKEARAKQSDEEGDAAVPAEEVEGEGDGAGTHGGELIDWSKFKELLQPGPGGHNLGLATPLIWFVWFAATFSYSAFNIFVPEFVKDKNLDDFSSVYALTLYYSLAALPGAVLGAVLVESKLGRKWTIASALLVTAVAFAIFTQVDSAASVIAALCVINFCVQIIYAGLFTITPEMYQTSIRSTGTGVATAISRVAGVLAPLAGGIFIDEGLMDTNLWISVALMTAAALCMAWMPFDTSVKAE